jgi:CheY-like chemotaxis protein
VLVVEDEDLVRDVWVEALEESGYAALGMASGAEALQWVSALDPHLILLDVMLPDMNGVQFLARLRANPAWANIPVMIVSGVGEALLQVTDRPLAEFPGLRVAGIVQKPVDMDALIDRVRRVVGPGVTERKTDEDSPPPLAEKRSRI